VLTFSWLTPKENDFWEASFMVPSKPRDNWQISDSENTTVSENERINRIDFCSEDNKDLILNNKIKFTFNTPGQSVRWPLLHYNPYTLYPYNPLEKAYARIAVKLDLERPESCDSVLTLV
ncbi:MAG: hypothetical protein ACYTFY_18085, partial [Planctomycetota bacterium]